ncbi:MAG TPA: thioredoxin family protein [Gammaproteobacteria bacterium]|nr:thioredoxin family protein [Gammaproteobacteria bacterium]
MALTYSNPMQAGTTAPAFNLLDTISGKQLTLAQLASDKATVIMFACNHCPYVQHILSKLIAVANTYQNKGVSFIAISSNDVKEYPQDSPSKMQQLAIENHFTFPYLYDESQQVAKDYGATCTPEFYIFEANLQCVYHGRFDESSPGKSVAVTGQDLCQALDAILAGKSIPEPQHPSMGCNIKWKAAK